MAHVSKDIQRFKRTYRKTGSVRSSALAAGYSKSVANMGLHAMPKTIQSYVAKHRKNLNKYAQLAREFQDVEERKDILDGALLANIASGKDKATNSLKMLGQTKELDRFRAESATGVIVINAAPIPSFDSIPGHSVTPTVTPTPQLPK